jgi:DNA polymerase III sliding clamp (beta) subunit (PCNA family)
MVAKLKKFIDLARQVVPAKSTLTAVKSVLIRNNKITVTDIQHRLEYDIDISNTLTIPFTYIMKIIKYKPSFLEITPGQIISDNSTLTFENKKIDDFPVLIDSEYTSVDVWNHDNIKQFYLLKKFVSKDELKPALTYVQINKTEHIKCIATDGHILREIKNIISSSDDNYHLYLTPKTLDILLCFKKNIDVYISSEFYRFESQGFVFYQGVFKDNYPETNKVIPTTFTGSVNVNTKELLSAITLSLPFTHPKSHVGVINIKPSTLNIICTDMGVNTLWKSEVNFLSQEGEPIEIGFNLKYVETALKDIQSKHITLKYNNPTSAMVLTNNSHEICLIMPIRIEEKK